MRAVPGRVERLGQHAVVEAEPRRRLGRGQAHGNGEPRRGRQQDRIAHLLAAAVRGLERHPQAPRGLRLAAVAGPVEAGQVAVDLALGERRRLEHDRVEARHGVLTVPAAVQQLDLERARGGARDELELEAVPARGVEGARDPVGGRAHPPPPTDAAGVLDFRRVLDHAQHLPAGGLGRQGVPLEPHPARDAHALQPRGGHDPHGAAPVLGYARSDLQRHACGAGAVRIETDGLARVLVEAQPATVGPGEPDPGRLSGPAGPGRRRRARLRAQAGHTRELGLGHVVEELGAQRRRGLSFAGVAAGGSGEREDEDSAAARGRDWIHGGLG